MEIFNFFKTTKLQTSRLEFRGQTIEIQRNPYQKTLRLNVHRNGKIKVSCRVNTDQRQISRFLSENETWLEKQLSLVVPPTQRSPFVASLRDTFRSYYLKQAKSFLPERLTYWSEKMNLKFNRVSIRGQRTRWGSCSRSGAISLNWKLMIFPLGIIDYVLIHELAHLRYPNHSRAFWNLVTSYCPDYREHRKALKGQHGIYNFLD